VPGMRISKGDDTSPMGNNRISGKRCRVSTGDAVSPEGDLLASPNFGICDTTRFYRITVKIKKTDFFNRR
jgi:hypothetical protein